MSAEMTNLFYSGLNLVLQGGLVPSFLVFFIVALQMTQRA